MRNPKKQKQEKNFDNVTVIENEYIKTQARQNKISKKDLRTHRIRMTTILLFSSLIIVPLAGKTITNVLHIQSLDTEIVKAKEEKKAVQEENTELGYQIKLLQDPEYVTKVARNNYYYSKDGEIIFSFPEDNASKMAEKEKESGS